MSALRHEKGSAFGAAFCGDQKRQLAGEKDATGDVDFLTKEPRYVARHDSEFRRPLPRPYSQRAVLCLIICRAPASFIQILRAAVVRRPTAQARRRRRSCSSMCAKSSRAAPARGLRRRLPRMIARGQFCCERSSVRFHLGPPPSPRRICALATAEKPPRCHPLRRSRRSLRASFLTIRVENSRQFRRQSRATEFFFRCLRSFGMRDWFAYSQRRVRSRERSRPSADER